MEAKHTPGPWEVVDGAVQLHISGNGTGFVATVGSPEYDRSRPVGTPTERANARLIAAAPAMLGALQDLVEDFGAMTGGCESLDVARAILKHLGVES